MRKFGIIDALTSLSPDSEWVLNGNDISGLEWLNDNYIRPSDKEIFAEVERLQSEYDAVEYQRLRKAEYPPIEDYVDGVVKGDQAQIDAYIAACQLVKDKYPKADRVDDSAQAPGGNDLGASGQS